MKKERHFLDWLNKVLKNKKTTKAQYFYDSPYGKNQHTITVEKGYKLQ
mgnify:CR=1 FL=1